mmetsp:Transcript_36776/g.78401  ORF Transcript_36776/g.78401 Transcript_36776/m.78401 type:complete len:200 (-) Transcript_36776:348-947(-)
MCAASRPVLLAASGVVRDCSAVLQSGRSRPQRHSGNLVMAAKSARRPINQGPARLDKVSRTTFLFCSSFKSCPSKQNFPDHQIGGDSSLLRVRNPAFAGPHQCSSLAASSGDETQATNHMAAPVSPETGRQCPSRETGSHTPARARTCSICPRWPSTACSPGSCAPSSPTPASTAPVSSPGPPALRPDCTVSPRPSRFC